MRVAYIRGDGSDPAVQNAYAELQSAGCDSIVFDSTPPNRPESKAALTSVLIGMKAGDTLLVTSLDQVASTVPGLLDRIADLVARRVQVKTLSGELDTADPTIAHCIQALWSFKTRAAQHQSGGILQPAAYTTVITSRATRPSQSSLESHRSVLGLASGGKRGNVLASVRCGQFSNLRNLLVVIGRKGGDMLGFGRLRKGACEALA